MFQINTMKWVRRTRDKQYGATKSKSFKDLIVYFHTKANKLHHELGDQKSGLKTLKTQTDSRHLNDHRKRKKNIRLIPHRKSIARH